MDQKAVSRRTVTEKACRVVVRTFQPGLLRQASSGYLRVWFDAIRPKSGRQLLGDRARLVARRQIRAFISAGEAIQDRLSEGRNRQRRRISIVLGVWQPCCSRFASRRRPVGIARVVAIT